MKNKVENIYEGAIRVLVKRIISSDVIINHEDKDWLLVFNETLDIVEFTELYNEIISSDVIINHEEKDWLLVFNETLDIVEFTELYNEIRGAAIKRVFKHEHAFLMPSSYLFYKE